MAWGIAYDYTDFPLIEDRMKVLGLLGEETLYEIKGMLCERRKYNA